MGKVYGTFVALFFAVCVCFVLLFGLPRPATIGTPYSQFKERWAQWEARRPESYSVHIQRSCFCFLTWSVHTTVEENGTERLQHDEDPEGADMDFSNRHNFPRNVDDVFRAVDRLYKEKAYRIDLRFDDTSGIPVYVSVDRESNAVDDEVAYSLDQYEVAHVG